MAPFSIKHNILLLISVVSAVLILVAVFVVFPAARNILALRHRVQDTQHFLEEQYEKTRQLRRTLRELNTVLNQVEPYKAGRVQEGDQLKIITELERIAQTHRIEQTLTIVAEESRAAGAPKAPHFIPGRKYFTFAFVNQGAFNDHVSYLKALEALPYYIVIPELQWEKRKRAATDPNVTLRFHGIIYLASDSL